MLLLAYATAAISCPRGTSDADARRTLMRSFGFPPISSPGARILILGSLPGRMSLARAEYYANPQNAFWRIVAAPMTTAPTDYAGRVSALVRHGIALWDVLAAATRSGSLDAAISDDAIPNNFRAFFHAHPNVRLVCFNGSTAAKLYRRYVIPTLNETQRAIATRTLPSTSGAHATRTMAQKQVLWSVIWADSLLT
jgi:TDG/mug DNA glycosylase family protein